MSAVNQRFPDVILQQVFAFSGTLPVASGVSKAWRYVGNLPVTARLCYQAIFDTYVKNRALNAYTRRALFFYPEASNAIERVQTVVSLVFFDARIMPHFDEHFGMILSMRRFTSDPLHCERVACIAELAEKTICKNLVYFFSRLALLLPAADAFHKSLNGGPIKKAQAIRNWLEEHATLLAEQRQLQLTDCRLSFVPSEIRFFPNLRALDLSYNRLSVLPPEAMTLVQLRLLAARENQLLCLPDWIDRLQELEYLDVSGNHLLELPDSIARLSQLRLLRLRGNYLERFPQQVCALDSLLVLDLSFNDIDSLPSAIGRMSGLVRLYLQHNCLFSLPRELGKLKKLQKFDVRCGRESIAVPQELQETEHPAIQLALKQANLGPKEPSWLACGFNMLSKWLFGE